MTLKKIDIEISPVSIRRDLGFRLTFCFILFSPNTKILFINNNLLLLEGLLFNSMCRLNSALGESERATSTWVLLYMWKNQLFKPLNRLLFMINDKNLYVVKEICAVIRYSSSSYECCVES